METHDCGKKVFHLLAFGALVVTLVTASGLPAQARDKSGVLKASYLIGINVQGTDAKKLEDIKD